MTLPSTLYPGDLDTAAGLLRPLNNWAVTLSAPVSVGSTDIAVNPSPLLAALAAVQPTNGVLSLGNEVVTYGLIDTGLNVFTGCSRGQDGTIATGHGAGERVELRWIAAHHNILVEAIRAIQATLGTDPGGAPGQSVATRLDRGLPHVIGFTATDDWSFTHNKRRIVGVQLWREIGVDEYALFTAPIQQLVDSVGVSTVSISLPAAETGYAVAS